MKRKICTGLLILSSFLMFIIGCKKENGAYLDKYTGSYVFTVTIHHQIFHDNFDTTYTKTVNGSISSYVGDLNNGYRRLFINFGEVINPEVLESGSFISESLGGAYSLQGRFVSASSVAFDIIQQSAGFAIFKSVEGVRR